MDPKEVMMMLEERYHEEFQDEHDREPNKEEEEIITQRAFDNIGDYYADLADFARDKHKERQCPLQTLNPSWLALL